MYFWSMIPVFLLTFTPQMLFDIRHQFLMTKTILGFLHGANSGTGEVIPFMTRLSYRIDEIQKATIFTIANNRASAYIVALSLPIFFISGLFFRWKKDLRIFSLFVIIPVLFFITFLFYPHSAWSWYWIGLQTSYYFLLAFVLRIFLRQQRLFIGFSLIVLCLWIATTIIPEVLSLAIITKGDTGTLRNELRIIDFVYRDAKGKPFGEFVYTPPVYDYAYQYLFWWKSKQYHYAATKDKNGIFYLILEPDKEHPDVPNGWKETVIKTGTVLWENVFPGNITIEKRMGNI